MPDDHNKIYEILLEMKENQGREEGKIDGINQRLDTVNGRLGKHDDRLGILDSFKDNLKGKVAVISLLVGGIGAFLGNLIISYLPLHK